ncbi:MAG: hypothetical protein KDF54_10675 [Hydrogenophaga sp.]|nr:hypothetical protein [Planctomycetaceae bacterium]MCB2017955.1 hypothetical protein [Hydrogenophaga sp.]
MTFLALIGHLLNFVAPALGVALLLWGAPRLWPTVRRGRWSASREFLFLWSVGIAVLLGGLVAFGRDGKMLTYAALVLTQGSFAAWLRRR